MKFVLNHLQFDFSFFNTTTVPVREVVDGKFPAIEPTYEAVGVKDLFIGTWSDIDGETVQLFPIIFPINFYR